MLASLYFSIAHMILDFLYQGIAFLRNHPSTELLSAMPTPCDSTNRDCATLCDLIRCDFLRSLFVGVLTCSDFVYCMYCMLLIVFAGSEAIWLHVPDD